MKKRVTCLNHTSVPTMKLLYLSNYTSSNDAKITPISSETIA